MTLVVQDLELVVGEDNLFDIDLNTDLDPTDEVWFMAKYNRADTDGNAVIEKKRSTGGIVDTDPGTGKCQVKVLRTDLSTVIGRALVYDTKVKKADANIVQTVGRGVIILLRPVNVGAA